MSMLSELIQKLRRYEDFVMLPDYICKLLKQAADTIEGLSEKVSEQNGGGWISVNDRLPETNVNGHFSEDMLVAIQWDDGDITTEISYYDSKSTNRLGKWSVDCFDYHVIAWQPLPPAYEPKED